MRSTKWRDHSGKEGRRLAGNVTVVGYGAVGRETVKLLADRGDKVRVAQRSQPRGLPLEAEFVPTDVLNAESLANACAGSETVICCVGFPYDSRIWQKKWPKAMTNLLAACEKAKARFIFADNLYMYGPHTEPLTEDIPLTDFGRKPKLRAEITKLWQDAHREGRVQAVAVRASDFYGPDVPTSVLSAYGVRMFTKVATVFMKAVTAEQSCKALSLRLSGTPPRGAVYPTGV